MAPLLNQVISILHIVRVSARADHCTVLKDCKSCRIGSRFLIRNGRRKLERCDKFCRLRGEVFYFLAHPGGRSREPLGVEIIGAQNASLCGDANHTLSGWKLRQIMQEWIAGQQPWPFVLEEICPMDPAQVSKTEVLNRLIPGWGAGLCILIIFGVICWLVFYLRSFWRDDSEGDASLHEMLSQFRESQREGVLTDEEYRLIKSRLVERNQLATVTERSESAEPSSDSVKGFANSTIASAKIEEPSTEMDSSHP